jgi:hypothetical protein
MYEAVVEFAKSMLTEDRWPFWATVLVFTAIGQFTSTKLFTRERAYRLWPTWWAKHFWWWGRESLMLHPIAAGLVLGCMWFDPEGAGWNRIASGMYFAAAGFVSMVAWALLKGALKLRGITVRLPGESTLPPPPSAPSDGAS